MEKIIKKHFQEKSITFLAEHFNSNGSTKYLILFVNLKTLEVCFEVFSGTNLIHSGNRLDNAIDQYNKL
jgi:stalled ribosome rescue protein Dom34